MHVQLSGTTYGHDFTALEIADLRSTVSHLLRRHRLRYRRQSSHLKSQRRYHLYQHMLWTSLPRLHHHNTLAMYRVWGPHRHSMGRRLATSPARRIKVAQTTPIASRDAGKRLQLVEREDVEPSGEDSTCANSAP